jgi:predicted enzyme related to lactoylglutathione lyase
VNWTLELVVLPISDIDRAKSFYMDKAGFDLNVDHRAGDDFRVVQLTPRGSACSIALMKTDMVPGSLKGLQMCVADIDMARAELLKRGVDASEVFHFGEAGQTPGYDPQRGDYGTFFSFSDPDGNAWMIQEVRSRG